MERQAQGAIWLNRLGSEYLDNINHSKCFEFEGKIGKKKLIKIQFLGYFFHKNLNLLKF